MPQSGVNLCAKVAIYKLVNKPDFNTMSAILPQVAEEVECPNCIIYFR